MREHQNEWEDLQSYRNSLIQSLQAEGSLGEHLMPKDNGLKEAENLLGELRMLTEVDPITSPQQAKRAHIRAVRERANRKRSK